MDPTPTGGGGRAPARRPDWVDEELFPFESRFVDLDGCHLHYIDEGAGPVLLLLHGNPTWSFLYRHLVAALNDRFRCIVLDYPGFGVSTPPAGYGFTPAEHAETLERFLLALELTGVTPFVHDWGGPIGLAVAARHPDRVRALVIGNTFAWPVDGDRHFVWFSRLFGGTLGRFAIRHFNALVNLIPAATRRRRLSSKEMAHYRRPLSTPTSREATYVLPREILASSDFLREVEAGLERLRDVPTLIVWGDRDVAFRAVERQRFEELFSGHVVVELAGAGHFIQEDAPQEIAGAITRWWGTDGP